jgi:hypothetical protein
MTAAERNQLNQRGKELTLRYKALMGMEQTPVVEDIIREYMAEVDKIYTATERLYEFIYNFKSGGWNTSSGYTLEEAQENARSRFPDMDIDFKSFRISTKAEEKQLLAMFY